MSRRVNVTLGLFLILSYVAISACGDSDNLIGPGNELEVTNVTDDFQFQVTALNKVTDSLTYSWENTGTSADFFQRHRLAGGSFTIEIHDADSQIMARVTLQCEPDCPVDVSWSSQTATGTSGVWTIKVLLRRTSGDLRFGVQKHDP